MSEIKNQMPDVGAAVNLVSETLKAKGIKIRSIRKVYFDPRLDPFVKTGDGYGFYMDLSIIVETKCFQKTPGQ